MMPNSFLILFGEPSVQTIDPVYESHGASLYVCEPNPQFIKFNHNNQGFELFIGEAHQDESCASSFYCSPAGTRITLSEENRALTVKCDRLGTAIVYWKQEGNRLLLSNRKENLLTQEDQPDWASVQQYLHTGFTIKSRTFIRGLLQTEPNTVLTASFSPKLNIAISKRPDNPITMGSDTAGLVDQLADQLSRKLSQSIPSVLMMSAGWDSRTLLLPGTSNLAGAYTHGDLSSREINLARKLTGQQRLDHLFVDVQSSPITLTLIDTMLHELGSGVFPTWFLAARNIHTWKDTPIMSGVLGELLGGHYGLMSWGSRTQKLLSSLLLLNDSLVSAKQVHASIELYCSPPKTHWFVSSSGQDILDTNRDKTKERTLSAINEHYRETGDWQRALEEFNMAHRARQYILKQAQAASSSVGYTIPFADEHLSDIVRALEFKQRIHNKTNQRMLQTRNPVLLREPMAATLIAAKYPILFQEFSRFFRIARENLAMSMGKEKPRLGWFNYEHLYQSNLLHDLTDSLTMDIWDKPRMHATLDKNTLNKIDAGSTLDMLCKIKTVDYYLKDRSRNTSSCK
jgi:hypothetical protein